LEEKEELIAEIHQEMEEQYEYSTILKEIADLKAEISKWMIQNDQASHEVDRGTYRIIRPHKVTWDPVKLAKLVPKAIMFKVTDRVVNHEKIDDLVRAGELDREKIAPALVEKATRPYMRFFPLGSNGDAETEELAKALND